MKTYAARSDPLAIEAHFLGRRVRTFLTVLIFAWISSGPFEACRRAARIAGGDSTPQHGFDYVSHWNRATMAYPASLRWKITSALPPVATAALAAAIFVADIVTQPGVTVAGLYVAVVLMATRFYRPRDVMLVASGCVLLTAVVELRALPSVARAEGVVFQLTLPRAEPRID